MPLLELKSLAKSYGHKNVLENISLSFELQECVLVMGPNGAGKSSLITSLLGRINPTAGEILYENRNLEQVEDRRFFLSHVGFLGHEPGLFYDLNGIDNLSYFSQLYGLSLGRADIIEKMESVSLPPFQEVSQYSRGMKQRLGLLRATLHSPRILLLDEPLTGLDVEGESFLLRILSNHRKHGLSIIVTHSNESLMGVATRLIFIKSGQIVADIAKENFTENARKTVRKILYP